MDFSTIVVSDPGSRLLIRENHADDLGGGAILLDDDEGQMNKIVSNHHKGIAKLGDGLEVWATSPDGLSEGIRRSDTLNYPFYIGVQWHPELCEPGNKFDESIGQSFINALISE